MIPVLHRAHHQPPEEIDPSWGVEIDIRDHNGMTVLSHDPVWLLAGERVPTTLHEWIQNDLRAHKTLRPLYALNIKADGLEPEIAKLFDRFPEIASRAFVFDMSFPSLMRFKAAGVPFAERVSEHEQGKGWSRHVWIDRWDWDEGGALLNKPTVLYQGEERPYWTVVSPELHRPNAQPLYVEHFWQQCFYEGADAMCTDYPGRLAERLNTWEA